MAPIHWRPILRLGLIWLFIVMGPAACSLLTRHPCNPRVIASCED